MINWTSFGEAIGHAEFHFFLAFALVSPIQTNQTNLLENVHRFWYANFSLKAQSNQN